jgi:hypothetical protein
MPRYKPQESHSLLLPVVLSEQIALVSFVGIIKPVDCRHLQAILGNGFKCISG